MAKTTWPRRTAEARGFRSGLEDALASQLVAAGIPVHYEHPASKIKYTKPASNHTYTPDLVLPNGIIIEGKGRFMSDDRAKHELIREQHPALDIRFVFSRMKSPITTGSKTTVRDWCVKRGLLCAEKLIPNEWLNEPRNERSIQALLEMSGGKAAELFQPQGR